MSRRGDNIHKRKDGRWEGRYKNGRNEFGKIKYSSVYGKTYGEVKEKLSAILRNEKKEKISAENDKSFQEILLLWKNVNKIKHKGATELKYDYLIEKHILPKLGKCKISKISTIFINDFINNELKNGRINNDGALSASYVKTIILIINSVLKFAQVEGFCNSVPTIMFDLSTDKKELRILNNEERIRLKKISMKDTDVTKLGILITLYTGMRIGEICALTWNNIDLESKIIHVRATISRIKNTDLNKNNATTLIIDKPKTKSSVRDIPICSELFPILYDMSKKAKSDYVVSDSSSFISPRTFEYRFHKVIDTCEIKPINYHILRHTFATQCVESGIDVKTLSEILGHSNVSITLNTYVHPSIESKRIQLEKLVNHQ